MILMNTSPALANALSHPAHPNLWRGSDFAQVATPSVPTGFAELDVHLPGGGWPTGVLTEIHVERPGIGELQLVMPAVARLTQADRWQVMIAPPYLPYAPALAAHGVKLSRLMLIRPPTLAEQLWACEQALQSEGCGVVMLWLDQTSERLNENALRRLQLNAERRDVLLFLFRASRAASCTSREISRMFRSKSPSVFGLVSMSPATEPSTILLSSETSTRPLASAGTGTAS